jgi:ankyrin repeat protein
VDACTGQARLLEDGSLMGIAPDGSQVAVADQAWVGPYKRGGQRVGPLRIVNLVSGRSRAVTDPLTLIRGGDWQLALSTPAPAVASPLRNAVACNDVMQARSLLAQGALANDRYSDDTTVLMVAAGEGNVEMVQLLLQFHADPNCISKSGETALMAAVGAQKAADEVATAQQIHIAQALVRAGTQLNSRNHAGRTALMEAAYRGRALVADWLLRQGAEVNARDNAGWSALMDAAANGYAHTTQVLLDHGAAVNLRNRLKETTWTLTQDASGMEEVDNYGTTIRLLKQAGAKE